MKNKLQKIAAEAVKIPAIKKWIVDHIRNGAGYSNPTDLFEEDPPQVTQELRKYFEGGRNPILYSREGAIALMDALLDKL